MNEEKIFGDIEREKEREKREEEERERRERRFEEEKRRFEEIEEEFGEEEFEEEIEEPKRIRANEIGDFWVKDIDGYTIDEVALEVYKRLPSGNYKKIDFGGFGEDERVLATGMIRPPLLADELKMYADEEMTHFYVKVRSLKTGKVIATQMLKIPGEPALSKKETRPIPDYYDAITKLYAEQNKTLMQLLTELLKKQIETKPVITPPPAPSVDAISQAVMKGIEIAEKIKLKEIEAQVEEVRSKREIEKMKLEQEHELRKIKLTQGVTVGDVVDKLEEEGKYEEKDKFLSFIESITNAIGKIQDLITALGLGGKTSQPFLPQSPQKPAVEEELLEEEEFPLEEEEIEETKTLTPEQTQKLQEVLKKKVEQKPEEKKEEEEKG